jgi:putative transposase
MHYEAASLYHVYNRGNNGQQLFFRPEHYHHFLRLLRHNLAPHANLLAYCLMPNHFHVLLQTTLAGTLPTPGSASTTTQPLSRGIARLLSTYGQGLNQELGRQGSVFQPKTKGKLLNGPFCEAGYPAVCFHYLHQNPVRAGLANELADWPYSSYRDYAGLRSGTLCQRELGHLLLDLSDNPEEFAHESAKLIDPARVRSR